MDNESVGAKFLKQCGDAFSFFLLEQFFDLRYPEVCKKRQVCPHRVAHIKIGQILVGV